MNKKKKYTRLKIEKKNIPDWPPIVVAVNGHNGNFAETENEPKKETRPIRTTNPNVPNSKCDIDNYENQ